MKSIFVQGSARMLALAAVSVTLLGLSGCGITKAGDVPEYLDSSFENAPPKEFITQGDLAKVRLGMSPLEVRNRLGPPMLGDKEEKDRWDYVLRKGAGATLEYLPYGVTFKDNKVVKISALEVNAGAKFAEAAPAAAAPVTAPAAEAAPVAADAAPSADSSAAVGEINDMLTGWANAWTAKDVNTYLGFYADTFEHGKKSRTVWEGQRKRLLSNKDTITLNLTEVQISLQSDVLAEVSFNQSYTSNKFSDKGAKVLVLNKASGAWKIQKETFKK